jgi:hypothetical protein
MNDRLYNNPAVQRIAQDIVTQENRRFLMRVYNWMCAGLLATALVAWGVSESPEILAMIFGNSFVFWGLIIAQVAMVLILSSMTATMAVETAMALFIVYAVLNGLTFSTIFVIYSQSSIATAFVVTGGMFGAMSAYGATTKKSLDSWGSFFFMGLIGLVIASLVNLFLQSSAVYWVTTYAGVLIFTGLTAYDTNKILRMNVMGGVESEEGTKKAILGALTLYLDFINLFLMLLRILGNRR